jgi:hypothetical protein
MVKTTINIEDELYEEIVRESIKKYGSTKNISRIINQRLKISRGRKRNSGKRVTFIVKKELVSLDADEEIRRGWDGDN